MNCLDLEHNFFGRKNTIDLLKRRVADLKEGYRQNLAILGYQYVGKTALLQRFYLNLDDRDVVPVYLCLENKDFSSFFYKFTGGLLYNYSKNKQLPLHHDLNLLIESCKKTIPIALVA